MVSMAHEQSRQEIAWRQVMEGGASSSSAAGGSQPNDDDGDVFGDFCVDETARATPEMDGMKVDATLRLGKSDAVHAPVEDEVQRPEAMDEERRRGKLERRGSAMDEKLKLSLQDRNKGLTPTWDDHGGAAIKRLLAHTALIDAQFLLDLASRGAVLPRNQDLPPGACITAENLHRLQGWAAPNSLPILVLSYPWVNHPDPADPSRNHPDPKGWLLRKLVPILEVMIAQAKTYDRDGAIGVMVDYCSLPQVPRKGDEERVFKEGLQMMHQWYSHPYTHVLICNVPFPKDDFYEGLKEYHQRGWCYYEMRIASLVTHRTLVWDLSQFTPESLGHDEPYSMCAKTMAARRPPPMCPDAVAKELRERSKRSDEMKLSFSYASDLEPVIDLYRRGFVMAIETFPELSPRGARAPPTASRRARAAEGDAADRPPPSAGSRINFQGLEWDDSLEPMLVEAFRYAVKHCHPKEDVHVNMARNKSSRPAANRISEVFGLKIWLHGI